MSSYYFLSGFFVQQLALDCFGLYSFSLFRWGLLSDAMVRYMMMLLSKDLEELKEVNN